VDFEYRLDSGLRVKGRIDRLDQTPDGRACIIDYKYSKKNYAKAANHVQAPLYWMAAERAFGLEPACMLYCGLRDQVAYTGWSNDAAVIPGLDPSEEWLASAVEATVSAAEAIIKGRIVPEPADREPCRYCDYRDVCRIDARAVAAIAEGA
jgi:RecB family exonuclease